MWAYIFKRLLLMVPTLFGILLITFVVIQFVAISRHDHPGYRRSQPGPSWSTIAGILLLGEMARNSGLNCSPLPISIGCTLYSRPVSSSMRRALQLRVARRALDGEHR